MIEIDGSEGEGGGQVLRTSLALSIVTGQPFRLFNIRAGRDKPGLGKQHLACVRAAQQISNAEVTGDEVGSRDLLFAPQGTFPGKYRFSVGSAGSAALVLQTVLYPLLLADTESFVSIEGGTHNASAPPLDFVQHAFLPLLRRMGADVLHSAERLGFFPAGGGLTHTRITPWGRREPLMLHDRGAVELRAVAYVASLPDHVAQRELNIVRRHLNVDRLSIEAPRTMGPGNALCVYADSDHVTEVVTAFGKRGKAAESVAKEAVREMKDYLKSEAPVGEHLADQLLLPMALGAGGSFRTLPPSLHTTTNISVIRRFMERRIDVREDDGAYIVEVAGSAGS
ncbi:MAG: RNA 3'-terminal phosphate cyclase [Planctomycetes bacterium]|nr:RNA 3'-terminal phosphate cyclase [Planctomycetota bacterium]MCW8135799.1 RNA 3'-terminal phosphate cyclase [Planctomycetota bacterium]